MPGRGGRRSRSEAIINLVNWTRSTGALCPVCRGPLEGPIDACSECETDHHPECFSFNGGCAVFGCGATRGLRRETGSSVRTIIDVEHVEDALPGEAVEGASRCDPADPSPTPCAVSEQTPLVWIERPPPPRLSDPVMFVGVTYVIGAILLTIPALGCSVMGTGFARVDTLLVGLGLALLVKGLLKQADRILSGDPLGRRIHLIACLVIAGFGASHCWPSVLALGFAAPMLVPDSEW